MKYHAADTPKGGLVGSMSLVAGTPTPACACRVASVHTPAALWLALCLSLGLATQVAAQTVDAGPAQTVAPGETVTLDGSGSTIGDFLPSFQWMQLEGPNVGAFGTTDLVTTFTAPDVTMETELVFELTLFDMMTALPLSDEVTITVIPNLNIAPDADAGD